MSDLKFRIKAKSANKTKTIVKARNFELIVDEPPALGGNDEGANPVEYLLAAYAGCLNVMSHVLAAEMNIELKAVEITIAGTLNPDKLFGKSDEDRAGYKQIEISIKPDTDASEDVLQKWLEQVCDRCPVSDNIKNITPVNVKLA